MPSPVQSVVSAYKVTLATGSCRSIPLQTPISSGLDDCSSSVWYPDLLLPCWKGKKKFLGGGGIFCCNLLGKKQKTTTGPDFVREDFIPKDDCKEMREECEMNYSNGENALTAQSARASLCGGANEARKKRVVDWVEWAWPIGPRQQRVFSGHGWLSGGVVEEGRLAGSDLWGQSSSHPKSEEQTLCSD